MAKNTKALNDIELHYIKTNYNFTLEGNYVYVSYNNYKRMVVHPISHNFVLSTKVRKITITVDAMKTWINKYKDKYSLIEVQNAINILVVTYQPITHENLELQLKRFQERELELELNI